MADTNSEILLRQLLRCARRLRMVRKTEGDCRCRSSSSCARLGWGTTSGDERAAPPIVLGASEGASTHFEASASPRRHDLLVTLFAGGLERAASHGVEPVEVDGCADASGPFGEGARFVRVVIPALEQQVGEG